MSTAAPIVQLGKASKRFKTGTLALEDVSLSIHPGEFISIVGPSGCGKSTVLRLVAGLERASSGVVLSPATDLAHTQGSTAFVFQEATLMPWANIFDNVWLPLRLQGVSRAQASVRILSALKSVGLEDFARAYPAELSGGMKMRVSIARALVTEPSVLLMDEPFAALDDLTRHHLNSDLLQWQADRSIATLFVTHNIAEAVFLSHRILVMRGRPGAITHEIHINEPYPRSQVWRDSETFFHHCRELHSALAAPSPGQGLSP